MSNQQQNQLDQQLQQFLKEIEQATTVAQLEAPMAAIADIIKENLRSGSPSLLLSHLQSISSALIRRASSISQLHDLGEGDDQEEQNNRAKLGNWFGGIAQLLTSYNMASTATAILARLWNSLGNYQRQLNQDGEEVRHIYRAGIGMYLGRIYAAINDPGAAVWWLLHAHADDILNQISERGGAAQQMLQLTYGVPDDVFEYMRSCANDHVNLDRAYTYFAEHLVMLLSLESQYSHLFSHPTSLVEFPIGHAYAQTMIDVIEHSSEGTIMEHFARYLILLIAGWVPTKNIYHWRTDIDSDVVARYVREPETISSAYGRAILCECKNVDRSLSVSVVGYFLYRMHLTHVDVGIIFAKKYASGARDEPAEHKNARHLLDLAVHRSGSTVVVIDLNDLRDIANGRKTIWSLIDTQITGRRFGSER